MANVPNPRKTLKKLTGSAEFENDDSSSSGWETDAEESETKVGLEVSSDNLQIMKALTLYTTLWSKILSPKGINGLDLSEFSSLLPKLREFFLCSVCEKLVSTDFTISSIPTANCSSLHLICEGCKGEEWKKPCNDHVMASHTHTNATGKTYLKEIIESYKGFCSLFIQTRECRKMIELKTEVDPTFDALTLINYLTEGALLAANVNPNQKSPPHSQGNSSRSKNNRTLTSPSSINKSEPQYFTSSESDSDEFGRDDTEAQLPTTISNNAETHTFTQEYDAPSSNNVRTLQFIHQPCFPNWPNPNHVIQYASGNISMSHAPAYSTPVSVNHSALPSQSLDSNNSGIVGSVVRAVAGTEKKLKVRLPKKDFPTADAATNITTKTPRRGCRCGNATANPGKLTCCGQRCPCYVERKLCIDCRCKGCRNPHQPDGKKLLPNSSNQAIEPRPELSNSISNSNAVTFQTIPEVPQTFTSIYPLNPLTSYTAFPIPVQVPISLVGLSSLLQSAHGVPSYSVNKF